MAGLYQTLGILAAAGLLATSAVQAEGFKPDTGCNPSGFTTCNAVHLNVLRDGLSIGERQASWREWAGAGRDKPFKLIPAANDTGHDGAGTDGSASTVCPVASHNPLDCPTVVTVTPEPVTMSLLATGLVGMSGMGFLRRKRKPRAD